jgi:hypothetical protein
VPKPPIPEKNMRQYIQEDFARLQSEVSSFLGDVPVNDPNRLIVDLCFDRVAQSVRVIDQEHQNKKEAKEIIQDASKDSKGVLESLRKKIKIIQDCLSDPDVSYLLSEVEQDVNGLVKSIQEAHELLKKEEKNGSHVPCAASASESTRSLFGLSL